MKKLRKLFEGGEGQKNREAEGAASIALGLMWMMMDGMKPIGFLFMVVGICDIAKGKKKERR